jgi:hypothetical protein
MTNHKIGTWSSEGQHFSAGQSSIGIIVQPVPAPSCAQFYETFLLNNLQVFECDNSFQPCLTFLNKGLEMVMLTNSRLGWKYWADSNTLVCD